MRTAVAALLCLCAPVALAQIEMSKPLPTVSVTNEGEVVLSDDDVSYRPWNTGRLTGRMRTVNHFAGRTSSRKINDPLIDAIKAAGFPRDRYQTTTIINTGASIIGTSVLVRRKAEKAKRDFPWSSVVVDDESQVQKAWGLSKRGNVVFILDEEGKVLFFKDGELTAAEIERCIRLLKDGLGMD